MTSARTAHVVGLGLIGASLALALRQAGWSVSGDDLDDDVAAAALAAGIITQREAPDATSLVAIATPAGVVAEVAQRYLDRFEDPTLLVTDVAGVKGAIVDQVSDARFLGGHPMAGSELRGLRGARADLCQVASP